MSTATQSLQPWVDRVRRGWRASPLPGFLGWWGSELRDMLPPRRLDQLVADAVQVIGQQRIGHIVRITADLAHHPVAQAALHLGRQRRGRRIAHVG